MTMTLVLPVCNSFEHKSGLFGNKTSSRTLSLF